MLQLSSDESFNYEILRTLALARYGGSDIGEVLEAADKILPGDLESFSSAFQDLANRVLAQAESIDASKYAVSARDTFFRASSYFRAADFYLHGQVDDPHIISLWQKQTLAFDRAIALLPIPGQRISLQAEGFDVPAIFYRANAADSHNPRPTIVIGNGYDGAQEELLHVFGFAALERGYNVVTYEGPGQPSVRRGQNLGFIPEWEKVLRPLVDYLVSRKDVDSSRIGLIGYSMGGWLAVRAAAFEHRIAAVFAVDGVYSVYQAYHSMLPQPLKDLFDSGEFAKVDKILSEQLGSGRVPTAFRWGVQQGLWSFNVGSASEFLQRTKKMTLKGIAERVECPVWIGSAEGDIFFKGQPELVRDALGERGTFVTLPADDGAQHHCHVGSSAMLNHLLLDWFEKMTRSS